MFVLIALTTQRTNNTLIALTTNEPKFTVALFIKIRDMH